MADSSLLSCFTFFLFLFLFGDLNPSRLCYLIEIAGMLLVVEWAVIERAFSTHSR